MLKIINLVLISWTAAIAGTSLDFNQKKDRTLIFNYFYDLQEFSWFHKELEAILPRDRDKLKKDIDQDQIEVERDPANIKPLSAEIYESEFSRLLRWVQRSNKMFAHGIALYDCSGALVGFADQGVCKHDNVLFPLLLNDEEWLSLNANSAEYHIQDIPRKKSLKYLTWVIRAKDKIIGVMKIVVDQKHIKYFRLVG